MAMLVLGRVFPNLFLFHLYLGSPSIFASKRFGPTGRSVELLRFLLKENPWIPCNDAHLNFSNKNRDSVVLAYANPTEEKNTQQKQPGFF